MTNTELLGMERQATPSPTGCVLADSLSKRLDREDQEGKQQAHG